MRAIFFLIPRFPSLYTQASLGAGSTSNVQGHVSRDLGSVGKPIQSMSVAHAVLSSRGADHLREKKTRPHHTKGKAGGAKREDQTTGAPLGNQMIPIHAHAYPSCISATTKLIWSSVSHFSAALPFLLLILACGFFFPW